VPRVRDGTLVFPPLLLARRHPVSLPTSARARACATAGADMSRNRAESHAAEGSLPG